MPCPGPLNFSHIADYIYGFLSSNSAYRHTSSSSAMHVTYIDDHDTRHLSDIAFEVAVANSVSIDATVQTGSRS